MTDRILSERPAGYVGMRIPKKNIADWLCNYRANLKHFEGMVNA